MNCEDLTPLSYTVLPAERRNHFSRFDLPQRRAARPDHPMNSPNSSNGLNALSESSALRLWARKIGARRCATAGLRLPPRGPKRQMPRRSARRPRRSNAATRLPANAPGPMSIGDCEIRPGWEWDKCRGLEAGYPERQHPCWPSCGHLARISGGRMPPGRPPRRRRSGKVASSEEAN
jgi:hypothetical protein